ncbi:ubiquinol-cytochrome C reductase complex subunit oxen [Dermatophagoides farinae]|uniref:Complex III subunit 9 n=1 Tax=Dermatophagoides farinae TaxID=6954 RepID=A0A922L1V1_DERFA|nr:cytochrome b-c1 complex subunit 9 [Dermatophagoides farinae]KAH9501740.1 Cytochrome b-c1 complex subunit 9 [Dermatophagoides farinae]
MSLGQTIYRTVFARTSTAALAVITMAFFFERGVSGFSDYTFDRINKGKQWKDIKHLYENK